MSLQENKDIVRRFHTELWSGNVAIVDELLADGFESAMGKKDDIKNAAIGARAVVPDLNLQIHEMIAEGDKVVMRWTMGGTYQGPERAPGAPASPLPGKYFEYSGITINGVANGKIVSDVFENSWHSSLLKMGVQLP